MDSHDSIPVTVTKAKVPFLTIELYKQYLDRFHEIYPLFDKNVAITQVPRAGVKCHHWDISVNSILHRNRSLFTVTYQEINKNDGTFQEVSTVEPVYEYP